MVHLAKVVAYLDGTGRSMVRAAQKESRQSVSGCSFACNRQLQDLQQIGSFGVDSGVRLAAILPHPSESIGHSRPDLIFPSAREYIPDPKGDKQPSLWQI